MQISSSVHVNIQHLKTVYERDNSLVFRELYGTGGPGCCAVFFDGMVSSDTISLTIMRPLIAALGSLRKVSDMRVVSDLLSANEAAICDSWEEAQRLLHLGDTLLFVDGVAAVLACNSKGGEIRAVSEPDNDQNLRGARDGFCETFVTNIALVRRRLRTPDFKCEIQAVGRRSNTNVAIIYLESLADPEVLTELKNRIAKIDMDGIIDSNYIEEQVKDKLYSPFKTVGSTEKPDIVAARLLEGRVAIIVDGTPFVLTVPYLFSENFHVSDDYNLNYIIATFGRMLRFVSFALAVCLPGLYISLVCFHKESIPGSLLLNIAKSGRNVPFPTIVECILMLGIFEILRETGVRIPGKFGQALSIVGALVLGQAAVESGIASPVVVIVIALAGITSMVVPRITGACVICRAVCILFAAVLGVYGFFFAVLLIFVHLVSMSSFGAFYLEDFGAWGKKRDLVIRRPFTGEVLRPSFAKDVKRKGRTE